MASLQFTITSINGFLRDGGSVGLGVSSSVATILPLEFGPTTGLAGGIAQNQTRILTFPLPAAVTSASQLQSVTVAYHPNGGIDEDQWDANITVAFIPNIDALPFAARPAQFRQATPTFELTPPAGTATPL